MSVVNNCKRFLTSCIGTNSVECTKLSLKPFRIESRGVERTSSQILLYRRNENSSIRNVSSKGMANFMLLYIQQYISICSEILCYIDTCVLRIVTYKLCTARRFPLKHGLCNSLYAKVKQKLSGCSR